MVNILKKHGFEWLLDEDIDEGKNESLLEELDIDLYDIITKIGAILIPFRNQNLLHSEIRDNPDFWGPLIVVFFYSIISLISQIKVVYWIILIWFSGSYIIFLLSRSLGGDTSFSQCLGIIGYCLLPLSLMCLLSSTLHLYSLFALLFKIIGVGWSTYSASSILCQGHLMRRRVLVIYPLILLYSYFLSLYTGV